MSASRQHPAVNLVRLGTSIRALRRRRGWRQLDLAAQARTSQQSISMAERGLARTMSLDRIERILAALEADAELVVRWRGGALDRVVDARHAALVGLAADRLSRLGLSVEPEVTYSDFGERGSIDLLALDRARRLAIVVEVKTELVSIEATLRKHDEKVRLAPKIASSRTDVGPWAASRLLVLPDTGAERRRVAANAAVLDRVYPLRGPAATRWLRGEVAAGASALLFLPLTLPASGGRSSRTPSRVRAPGPRPATHERTQPPRPPPR